MTKKKILLVKDRLVYRVRDRMMCIKDRCWNFRRKIGLEDTSGKGLLELEAELYDGMWLIAYEEEHK